MKKTIIILLVVLTAASSSAQKDLAVTSKEAMYAAIVWLKSNYSDLTFSNVTVDSLVYTSGRPLLYEVTTDSLSVLLSGNRACLPILGTYKIQDSPILVKYEKKELPCTLYEFVTDYADQVVFGYDSNYATPYYGGLWDSIINGLITNSNYVTVVGPLISTRWGQSNSNDNDHQNAYNYYAPGVEGECEHCYAGCVAVAMAQIMNYWKTPVLSINLDRQFDWCNMTDELNTSLPNYEVHRDAIAHLIRECGKSVNMYYGCDGSNAYTSDAVGAYVGFGYSDDAHYSERRYYSSENWKNKLKNHIDWGFPVMYRGSGSGGHSFVCDGYNSNRYFHFNWGWTGTADGYFSVDELTPNYYNEQHNYNNNQGAVFYIHPADENDVCDITQSLDIFYIMYYLVNSYGSWSNDGSPLPPTLPKPYEVTPQTMTALVSAHSSTRSDFRTIPSGDTAVYRAHREIVLQDGFEAEWGSDFTAEIVPCPACEEPGFVPIYPNFDSLFPLTQTVGDSIDVVGDAAYSHMVDFGISRAEVFPNPTTGELTVVTDGMAEAIVVYNAAGQPVGGWDIASQGETWLTLDFPPSLPQGTYIVVLRTKTGTSVARVVRQ